MEEGPGFKQQEWMQKVDWQELEGEGLRGVTWHQMRLSGVGVSTEVGI
jgi:hypothetical protein